MLHRHQRRKGLLIDMTAMADIAFLLLTFFILTSHYRPQGVVEVDPPSAHNPGGDPDQDFMLVYVKNNRVYLDIRQPEVKKLTLQNMARKYGVKLTDDELDKLISIDNFGEPMNQLKRFTQQYRPVFNVTKLQGIPINYTDDNEFVNWLKEARNAYRSKYSDDMRVCIKADANESYPIMKLVIANMQQLEINKFSLIVNAVY